MKSSEQTKVKKANKIKITKHNPNHLNTYLPYRFYEEDTAFFHNTNSVGFMKEMTVLAGANQQVITQLSSLIKDKFPEGKAWNFGFSLVGSQHTHEVLASNVEACKVRGGDHAKHALFEHAFVKKHAITGFKSNLGLKTALRDYKAYCFFSSKSKQKDVKRLLRLKQDVETAFSTTGIGHRDFKPEDLIQYIHFIGNNDLNSIASDQYQYDRLNYLSKQVLSGDTKFGVNDNSIDWQFRNQKGQKRATRTVNLSLRSLPFEFALGMVADLYADIANGQNAIQCPFIMTMNFEVQPLSTSKAKSSRKLAGKRRIAGNAKLRDFFPLIDEDIQEWDFIVKGQDKGQFKLANMTLDLMLFTSEENYDVDTETAISCFKAKGMSLSVNEELQWEGLFSTLPFCKHDYKMAASQAAITQTVTTFNIANMLPIVADYKGSKDRIGLMLPTFRNQVFFLDNFKTEADNYNMVVCAYSGAGKSVFMQALYDNHIQRGGELYLFDKGGSSRKYAISNKAKYLSAKDININPFRYISNSDDSEYLDASNKQIATLISVMAEPEALLDEVEKSAILAAVSFVRKKYGQDASIELVVEYLETHYHEIKEMNQETANKIFQVYYNLRKYTRKYNGHYANVFSGEGSILEDGNPITILELEDFEYDEELLKIVVFSLMVVVNEKMYRSGKKRRKMCAFEEAWKLIGDSSPQTANMIECGYRTARKFNGAFVVITQGMEDFLNSKAAEAAWNNAGVKIIMRQNPEKFAEYLQSDRNIFTNAEAKIINSFQKAGTAGFSSLMIKAGGVTTFNRLFLDPYKRILLTTEPNEDSMVEELVTQGIDMDTAVYLVAARLYGDEIPSEIHAYFADRVKALQGEVAYA